jgi:hypothetical protein
MSPHTPTSVLCINPPLTSKSSSYLESLSSKGLCKFTFLPQSDRSSFRDDLARLVKSTPEGFRVRSTILVSASRRGGSEVRVELTVDSDVSFPLSFSGMWVQACVFFLRYDIPAPFPLDEEVLKPLVEEAGCKMITAMVRPSPLLLYYTPFTCLKPDRLLIDASCQCITEDGTDPVAFAYPVGIGYREPATIGSTSST